MESHVKIEHQHFRHICHVCAREFRTLKGLEEHLMVHEGMKTPRVQCELCPSTLRNRHALYIHVASMHNNDPSKTFKCPHCPVVKKSSKNLSNHVYSMHTLKLLKCQLCEREFREAKTLKVSTFWNFTCSAFPMNR